MARKTDDETILKMLKKGKTQKEIAEYFKVSPVAIHKRVKRLIPLPESLKNLTEKEQNFCIEVAKGKTQTQAVMDSYEVTSRESAKVMGSQLMAKPEIQMSIAELMQPCGIDKPYRIRRLKNIIDCSDLNISHKGLDMSFKLDGSYAPEKNISMNIDALTEEQVQKYQELVMRITEYEIQQIIEQDTEKDSQDD